MKKPVLTLAVFLSFPISIYGQDKNAKLLEVSKTRDTAQVQKLLGEGADPNTKDKNGWTPLIWAASFGRTDSVHVLLEKSADVNAKDKIGWTALMSAASKGHTDTVLALVKNGADVNAKDKNGWTALIGAADSGHTDTVRALLKNGAEVNAKDNNGWTALIGAADSGHTDTMLALLEKGADGSLQDQDGNTALSLAEKHNYPDAVALLKNPAGIAQSKTPKKQAPKKVDVSPASAASTPFPTVNPQPATAASPERLNLIKSLLDAAEAGDTADVQTLLAKGADANGKGSNGNTVLMAAAVTGHTDIVRLLLEKGADVNARGNAGRTALMEAAVEGYTDSLRALLEKGADVNAKDDEGWSALFWAAFSRRSGAVRALLEKGADANAKNKYDDTALIRAAYGGDMETLSVLLENRADVNAKDNTGRTALMEAARQGHTDALRALLEKGADTSIRDRDGDTALSIAEKNKNATVIALLKNPSEVSRSKTTEKATTGTPDAPPVANAPSTAPAVTGVQGLDKKTQAQVFYRIGLNMQMIEAWGMQTSDLAAGWAMNIQQDLRKIGAPSELVELASQARVQLKLSSRQSSSGPVLRLIHGLRVGLDGFCKSHAEENFFYSAGGFTYRLNLLGEDMKRPDQAHVSVEDTRRAVLPLANAMAEQCSVAVDCKERALIYFLDVTTILKKAQLAPADGTALVKASSEIEAALSGEEH